MSSRSGGSALNSWVPARRSLAALASQDLVSTTRGSGGIEQLALAKHGGRQRGLEAESAVEALTGPDEHVGGNASAPEDLVGQSAAPRLGGGVSATTRSRS
jgi:hypothetical protein